MFKKVAAVILASTFAIGLTILNPFHTQAQTNPFSDVKDGDSHSENILSLYHSGIMTGVTSTSFKPNSFATRGETAQFIVNALGLNTDEATKNPEYPDVSTSNKYYHAIAILSELNVVGGYTNGKFGPNDSLTRSQVATMITRAFELSVATTTKTKFTDVNRLNDLNARSYIQTLVNYGITIGTTATTFSPNKNLTRGQLATFLVKSMSAKDGGELEVISVE